MTEHTTLNGSVSNALNESTVEEVIEDFSLGYNIFQQMVVDTQVYPLDYEILYPALGLTGEAGEVAEKVKKWLRDEEVEDISDERREAIAMELGDVLWYVTALANDIGYDLAEIAAMNMNKLYDRQDRNVIKGEGDDR